MSDKFGRLFETFQHKLDKHIYLDFLLYVMVTADFLLLLSSTAFSGSFAFAAHMGSSPSSIMVVGFRTDAILMLFKVQIFALDYVICGVGGGRRSTEVVLG